MMFSRLLTTRAIICLLHNTHFYTNGPEMTRLILMKAKRQHIIVLKTLLQRT